MVDIEMTDVYIYIHVSLHFIYKPIYWAGYEDKSKDFLPKDGNYIHVCIKQDEAKGKPIVKFEEGH